MYYMKDSIFRPNAIWPIWLASDETISFLGLRDYINASIKARAFFSNLLILAFEKVWRKQNIVKVKLHFGGGGIFTKGDLQILVQPCDFNQLEKESVGA